MVGTRRCRLLKKTRLNRVGNLPFIRSVLPLLLVAAPLQAQSPLPPELNLFGDEIVQPVKYERQGRWAMPMPGGARDDAKPKLEGFAHTLFFHDGRQLRGEIVSLDKNEIVWRRPDASAPLHFARAEIGRLVLSEKPELEIAEPGEVVGGIEKAPPLPPPEPPSWTTVKLPGGDWLFGDLTSTDGQSFTLKMGADSAFTFPRSAIEWLHFGLAPAPAFGFFGDALATESWILGNGASFAEAANGRLKLPTGGSLGRMMSPPARFEVSLEIPVESDNPPIRLWLQPYGLATNSYSPGTVEISFGQKELGRLIYVTQFQRETSPLPKNDTPGPARYRIFYDGPGERVIVLRNGQQVGDWPMRKKEEQANLGEQQRIEPPRAICFDRGYGNQALELGRFRVQPWDGILPKEGEAPPAEDRLTAGKDAPKFGKLEAVTEKELVFSGETKPRVAGTFLQFPQTPAVFEGAEAMLIFGRAGELSAAELEIRDDRARARTSFAALDVPLAAFRTIAFPRRKATPPPQSDVLVFQNGDVLRGKLLSAAKDAPVRWRLEDGQEVEFQSARLAGVRLEAGRDATPMDGATIELRNGDRLRGEIGVLDDKELRVKHPLLGERRVERARLWSLYPNPKLTVSDGGADPLTWLGMKPKKGLNIQPAVVQADPARYFERIHLDGHFIAPPRTDSSSSTGVNRILDSLPERYELRCTATDAGGADPSLNISLSGSNGSPSLQLNLGYGQLRIYSHDFNRNQRRAFPNNREIGFVDKLSVHTSRRAMRVFVDTKLGTADIFLDGVAIAKFGQQASERAPGIGAQIAISAHSSRNSPLILSDLWLGPWNGELPRGGENAGMVLLGNGDTATGKLGGVKDGKLLVESDAGVLEVPFERVQGVEFGGAPAPEKAAARLRLTDGAVVHVDAFRWENGELTAHSAALGDLKLPAKALAELILAPAPARFPLAVETKKLAKREDPKPEEAK